MDFREYSISIWVVLFLFQEILQPRYTQLKYSREYLGTVEKGRRFHPSRFIHLIKVSGARRLIHLHETDIVRSI